MAAPSDKPAASPGRFKRFIKRASDRWAKVPASVRKPIVFIVGIVLVILAGLSGPLPGPGGIPLFLLAIAILATEFAWAKAVENKVLAIIEYLGRRWREHKVIGTVLGVVVAASFFVISYFVYKAVKQHF